MRIGVSPIARLIDEERKQRHQAQREQVERAFALDARVDRAQLVAELALHPVAQQEAADEERQRRADAGGERDDQRAPPQAEDRAAEPASAPPRPAATARSPRRRPQSSRPSPPRMRVVQRVDRRLLRLEILEREVALQIEREEGRDRGPTSKTSRISLARVIDRSHQRSDSSAPPQLDPWPAVQPKQWSAIWIGLPRGRVLNSPRACTRGFCPSLSGRPSI